MSSITQNKQLSIFPFYVRTIKNLNICLVETGMNSFPSSTLHFNPPEKERECKKGSGTLSFDVPPPPESIPVLQQSSLSATVKGIIYRYSSSSHEFVRWFFFFEIVVGCNVGTPRRDGDGNLLYILLDRGIGVVFTKKES